MSSDSNKKYKRPKQSTEATTNPESSRPRNTTEAENHTPKPLCPLLAKDSEWVDNIFEPSATDASKSTAVSDEEEVLQLVDCEDGPQMKPLAIMFPGLLENPQTLQGMLDRAMSTTEVTRYLVDLGQKANFTSMKKANRLIPPEKQWMESLTENSNSYCSLNSELLCNSISSDYEADTEIAEERDENKFKKRKKHIILGSSQSQDESSYLDKQKKKYQ